MEDTDEHQDQGAAYYFGGYALAQGEDTLTMVDSTGKIVDHGRVTTAKITIKATAAAEGDDADTFVDTYVYSTSDISHLKIKEISAERDGVSYDVEIAKFKSVDLPDNVSLPGGPKHKEKVIVIERDGDDDFDLYLDLDLDGNVATVTFDVEVHGDNTLASADADALVIEDVLSNSSSQIEAAVD